MFDDLDEGDLGSDTGAGATAPPVTGPAYELDLDSTDDPGFRAVADGSGPPPPPAAPRSPRLPASMDPPADPDARYRQLEERAARAEQQSQMALGAITPYLQGLQRQANGQQPKPQRTYEQLITDPDVTTKDLVEWVRQDVAAQQQQGAQMMELTARRANSEATMRGQFGTEKFGDRNFDAIRARYVNPTAERVPWIKDMCAALNPTEPARVEYGLGVLMYISELAKDDPVGFYEKLFAAIDGQPAEDVSAKIESAARHAAAGIARGSSSGRQRGSRGGKVSGRDIWDMDDAAFDRLDQQVTGGI